MLPSYSWQPVKPFLDDIKNNNVGTIIINDLNSEKKFNGKGIWETFFQV